MKIRARAAQTRHVCQCRHPHRRREVLAVPVEAVFDTGKRQIVFVDKGDGILEPVDARLGAKGEDFYEVQAGLSEGDMVVTSGNFLVDSESRLKASLEGMTGTGGHQHGQ